MEYFTVLTNLGATKIAAAAAANSTIALTQIAVGDGSGTVPVPDISQTALVNEVFRTDLSELTQDEINTNHFIARSVIPEDEGNFWIREIGVFDADGDLVAVGNYPETYKSILTEGAAKSVDLNVVFEVANADVVNLTIDPTIVMASQDYVNQKLLQKLDKSDFISLITANCLVGGTVNATEVDTTSVLDIFGDNLCLACYNLENNTNDLSNNFNGIPLNVSYIASKYGLGAYFSGDGHINTGWNPTTNFTISCHGNTSWSGYLFGDWVNPTSNSGSGWGLSLNDTSITLLHYVSSTYQIQETALHNCSGDINIILSYNGTTAKVLANGIEIISVNYTASAKTNPLHFGRIGNYSSGGYGTGTIDQIRILNRAITPSEALLLSNEKYLTSVTLDNANIAFSNGKSKGYDLSFESITQKALSELTFQTGWNEVIKTKAGAYTVSQNLSLLADSSDGVSNYFSINDGKYYDKDGVHLENQAPILQILFDGTNIIEVKKVEGLIGHDEQKKGIGFVQDYQDVTNMRDAGELYRNTTEEPICVIVSVKENTSFVTEATIEVNAKVIGDIYFVTNSYQTKTKASFGFIVPPNQTYRLNIISGSLNRWSELRN